MGSVTIYSPLKLYHSYPMSSVSINYTKIKAYLDLLLIYQEKLNEGLVMTFDKGYWWCTSDKALNQYEKYFLKIGNQTDLIITELTSATDIENKTQLLHLLGWASDKKMAGDVLVQYISSKNINHANASLRSLFPMVVAGQYPLDYKLVRELLHSRHLVVKNKILGLLAFLPEIEMNKILKSSDLAYIKKLTKHKNKPLIATPAQMVIGRL